MVFQKIDIHPVNHERVKTKLKQYVPTDKEYKDILEHLRQLANGEVTGKVVGEKRIVKLLHMFGLFFKNYKKSTSRITKEDLSNFKDDLLNDRIVKEGGEKYSDTTKEDLTETIVRYLEWKYPRQISRFVSKNRLSLRKWFVIRSTLKTPETLTEQEVKKLLNAEKTIRGKYIIAGLFGSGARIEEFLNWRFEDFEEPTTNFPYYKIDIKREYSKTEERKIGMYWEFCTEAIAKYLATVEKKDNKDRVLEMEYDAVRMFLKRLSEDVLSKRVTPHTFRKSSATYYASKLNRQQLCVRFGWKFKSDMPDVYIKRAGVDEIEVKDVMLNDDISVLRDKLSKESYEREKLQEDFKKQVEQFEEAIYFSLKGGIKTNSPYFKLKAEEKLKELAPKFEK